MTPDGPLDPMLAPGIIVGRRYRIEAAIGRGGFGAVFQAVALDSGARVALKVLLPRSLHHPAARARFQREAELARQLVHENTVRLLDFGVGADGSPFMAWELLHGISLEAAISSGPLDISRVVHIATQILQSLHEAHERGIVHRDIKPANVFLCAGARQDRVKVLDFGIAKQVSPDGALAATALTRFGEMPGTPSYMAPEQITGGPVTGAIDLYALGLVMAESLTGRRVFDGLGSLDILRRQLSLDPVPLPQSVAASPLGPIIARATRKDVAERYPGTAEMIADLDAVVSQLRSSPLPVGDSRGLMTSLAMAPTEMGRAPIGQDTGLANTEQAIQFPEQAAPVRASPRAPRRLAGPVVGLAVGVVLLVALALLGVTSLDSTDWNPLAVPRAGAKGRTRGNNPPFRAFESAKTLGAVLADEGWEVVSVTSAPPTAPPRGLLSVTAVIQKDAASGIVYLQRFADEQTAIAMDAGLRASQTDSVSKRDGLRVLLVSVSGDRRASQQLLSAITR